MKNNHASDVKVGIVSLAAMLVLLIGIILGQGIGLSSTTLIKMRFPNSGSIQATSPVLINGVKRGSVKDVINDRGSVLITAEMDNIDDIYSDATAQISILEITGGKKIEIMPGKSGVKFGASSEIPGKTPADLADLVARAGELVENVETLLVDADTAIRAVNKILADGVVNEKVRNILGSTDNLTQNLNKFVDRNVADLESCVKNANHIVAQLRTSIDKNEPKVSALVDELGTTIKKTNALLANIDKTVGEASGTFDDIKKITRKINSGEGTIGKIIYDDNFAKSLDSTLFELNDLVKQLKKHGINANIRLGSRP